MKILLTTRREKAEQRNPIALLDLSAYLRGLGHDVDCYYLDQLTKQNAKPKSYDFVGLSVLQVLCNDAPLRDSIYLKKKFGTRTVVGGKWVQTLTQKEKDRFRNEDIEVFAGQGEKYFEDREIKFDSYPSWNRRDFETLQDVRADVMSTRGCPYHCHFCHNTERKISFFSPKRTVDNIELLFSMGVSRISFCDDIFTLKPSHMEAVYKELKARSIPIENRTEFFTHVNHINQASIEWIRRYRPFQVNVGVESGDDRMLRTMGKGFDSETAYRKLTMLHEETRVRVGTLFVIGFPGETEESLHNTLKFMHRIRPFAGSWVSYYQPVRGTVGYEMARERKGEIRQGKRNMSISYVDPNLSKRTLFKYNYQMMDFSPPNALRRKMIYRIIDFAPSFILENWRKIRQRKRLRRYMDSYLKESAA